jgi:hypothetical protein
LYVCGIINQLKTKTMETKQQIAKRCSENIRQHLMYDGNLEMTNQKEDYILMTYDRKRENFALHLNGKCVKIAKKCSTIIIYLYENGTEQIKLITN